MIYFTCKNRGGLIGVQEEDLLFARSLLLPRTEEATQEHVPYFVGSIKLTSRATNMVVCLVALVSW